MVASPATRCPCEECRSSLVPSLPAYGGSDVAAAAARPVTGVRLRAPSRSELLDAELRARGDSLDAWAERRGLATLDVVAAIEGLGPARAEIAFELAEALGIAPDALG